VFICYKDIKFISYLSLFGYFSFNKKQTDSRYISKLNYNVGNKSQTALSNPHTPVLVLYLFIRDVYSL